MRSESRKSDSGACRCATRCNMTLTKISCIMILFTMGSNAQNQAQLIGAQLSGSQLIEKDSKYFWEQQSRQEEERERERQYYQEEDERNEKSFYNAYNYNYADYERQEAGEEPQNLTEITAQYEAELNYADYKRQEAGEEPQNLTEITAQYEAEFNYADYKRQEAGEEPHNLTEITDQYEAEYNHADYPRQEAEEEPQHLTDITAQYEAVDDIPSDYVDREEKPCTGGIGCPKRRVSLDEAKAMMVATVKLNLLHALKMAAPPNGTHPKISLNSPPIKHLMRLHGMKEERIMDDEYDDDPEYEREETSKETVISYAKQPLYPGQSGSYFTFNEDDLMYNVESAVIWFYVKANPTTRTSITIDFYRYQQNTIHPDAAPVEVKFNTKVIHTQRKGHWRQMSVKHTVSKWFINPETNLGIDIRCREIPGIVFSGPVIEHDDKKPILEVALSHSAHSRRRKRDVNLICTAESNHDNCCRYKISISFVDMGWNWIVSPKRYTTYYCAGDCPAHYLETNQNRMMGLMTPSSKPPGMRACCTPTAMSNMNMLYWDNQENIIYSTVPNMRVTKCGCM